MSKKEISDIESEYNSDYDMDLESDHESRYDILTREIENTKEKMCYPDMSKDQKESTIKFLDGMKEAVGEHNIEKKRGEDQKCTTTKKQQHITIMSKEKKA